ncbi:MAG TPA: CPBP family intramembrane glutamic endopeptidase, partial [Puia sp.]|nr:CPBP family intramembrane glutamic endopeptidase [Puia sp.]
ILSTYAAGRLEISRPTVYWISYLSILLFIAGTGSVFLLNGSLFGCSVQGILLSVSVVALAVLFESTLRTKGAAAGRRKPDNRACQDIPTSSYLLTDQLKKHAWIIKGKQTVIRWIIIFALIGCLEEICYRGIILQTILYKAVGAPRALLICLQVILFGLNHVFFGARQVLMKTLLGLLLTVITLVTGTLVPAMLAHSLFNAWAIYDSNKQLLKAA